MADKGISQSVLSKSSDESYSGAVIVRSKNPCIADTLKMTKSSQGEAYLARHNILFFGSNPQLLTDLCLGEEIRDIKEGIQLSQYRENIKFAQHLAVRPRDFLRGLGDFFKVMKDPTASHIVHFSGRIEGEAGLYFEDGLGSAIKVSSSALSKAFKLFSQKNNIECVVLNGCYEKSYAVAVAEHVRCVIGIPGTVKRKAATEFSVAFYDALGRGDSIDDAFELGNVAMELCQEPELSQPDPLTNLPTKNKFFVEAERQQEILSITQFLLEARKNDKKNVIILWGPEGYGKTDLAKEIVSREDIQSHFKKGLFWLDCQGKAFEEELQSIYDRNISSDLSTHSGLITTESNQQEDIYYALVVLDHMQEEPDNFETIYKNSSQRCVWLIISDQYKSYSRYSKVAGVEENKLDIHVQTPLSAQTYAGIILQDLADSYNLTSLTLQDEVDIWDKIDCLTTKVHSYPSDFPKVREVLASLIELKYCDYPKEALDFVLACVEHQKFPIIEKVCLFELSKQATVLSVFRRGIDIPFSIIRKLSQQDTFFVSNLCHQLHFASLLVDFIPGKSLCLTKRAYQKIKEMAMSSDEIDDATPHQKIVGYYAREESHVHNVLYLYNQRQNNIEEAEGAKNIFSQLGNLDDSEKNYLVDFYAWHVEESHGNWEISSI